ncbi:hypothetical protein K8B83_05355 [Shewanella inventionis]|uniref:Uncharacterized protein n=1 Tax=Shewanella inventionis TaxID=1738770 RepID=A0ABQ1INK7_9GAMM|nr:hypothetical protein [Shewanella inventionis]MCL1156582.1 hypothetical protein [Shewanella inventionis]UAL44274.1 hypothetical protein K8B83_05355 [Shewanella inventionis]GGB46616.1 hypothetical protein GCM10011607_03490 [Shewanella inventionis]
MQTDKSALLLSIVVASTCIFSSVSAPVNAKEPLHYEQLDRQSHSVGKQHDGRRHSEHRTRHRDPWRWNVGWNTHWGINSAFGPHIGIGWNNSFNTRYGYRWGWDDYTRHDPFLYPYRAINIAPTVRHRVVEEPVSATLVVSAPQQITTHTQVKRGLSSLPENAKVIQRASGTVYEWQGVEYYFDWNTQTYELANAETP